MELVFEKSSIQIDDKKCDLENFKEILVTVLNCGVKKVIPHVYSSIIDKESGNTRIEDVRKLLSIIKEVA